MPIIGGVDLGNLPLYLLFYSNGSVDANWQGATKGFIGDVAVDGIQADERTSGGVPYAGTIYTNDATLGAWQNIVNQNLGQAFASYNEVARIAGLEADLVSALQQINALTANPGSLPAPYNVNFDGTIQSLDGLNTQNGIDEVFVLNITSNFNGISSQIDITGDAGDVFIFRWDTDANPANGYQGQVKFQSGGAIVPHGGLKTTNFINAAGNIGSSGGGSTPPPPYPQGPRTNDGLGTLINGGADFSGGGFFSGYWLTTGSPDNFDPATGLWYGGTSSLSNAIFAGGWYSITDQFSMTSGTSGVYVSPNPATLDQAAIDVEKEVSPDNGVTWFDADAAPGPNILQGTNPQFRFTVTNTGTVTLTNVQVTDNVYGLIGTLPSLAPGASFQWIITRPWAAGQHVDTATATGHFGGKTYTDTDPAHYFGVAAAPAIDVEKEVSPDNGVTWFDADAAPGPSIPQGTSPQFRFTVTNTGNVTLTNVVVTDNVYGAIGTLPSLAPGASFQWIITRPWVVGQHVDTATATGDFGAQTVSDTDPAHYLGVIPLIDVEKEVSPDNGVTWFDADAAPGPNILQGTNPQFRFTVTNTGTVTLTNVQVTDNVYGLIGTLPSLAPGASFQWTIIAPWAAGQNVNIATATGVFQGQTVTDADPAYYLGISVGAAIDVLKEVSPDNGVTWFDANAVPGPLVPQGTNPQFRYTVTNTGNAALTNVVVTDNVYGAIGGPVNLLPGQSSQFIIIAPWVGGQHVNIATATGTTPTGQTVTDTDPAHYFGVTPAIDVEKQVSPDNGVTWLDADAPTGPIIPQGINPQFRFIVTNTGNATLTNVQVTDNVYGLIGSLPSLAPGASFQWIIIVPWVIGQQVDIATATGSFAGQTYTDTDPAHYFGVVPAIDVEKEVSPDNGVTWFDADAAPGPDIPQGINPQFRFTVTNTGTVTLTNVQVTDNVYGLIGTLPSLAPGASFQWTITRPWTAGQQVDIATATGDFQGITVTDTDPAHYVGVTPAIDVEKEVSPDNGVTWFDADAAPGPNIPQGTNPQFRFTVTNTGNVTLTNVVVTDNVYGLIGTLPSLASGASFQWIITRPWAAGQQVDIATATGDFQGITVTDTDPAHYVGVIAAPAIDVEKEVSPDNGVTWFDADAAPGPNIPQGTNPQFRFTVTNTGNVTLTNVVVTDNVYGLIGTLPSLASGASFQWIITRPWAAGQHVDTATATGTTPAGQTVTDTDPAHYVGVPAVPAIDIEKEVSPDNGVTWFDADTAPGPNIPQGTNPQFRFTVTNTGNVTLTNVQVTDNVYGLIGTLPSLAPGASFQWIITRPWAAGQHVDTATATGTTPTGQTVTDTDQAHYVGVPTPAPSIDVQKEVSPDNGVTWFDADTAPGPNIPQGTNPQFRFTVTNTGNVILTNVQVTDNVYGLIGTLPSLAPGASFQWIITRPWAAGQQVDIATATGTTPTGQTVTDTDPAYYVGVPTPAPSIDVQKEVSPDNGVTWFDADTAPGPSIPQGTNPKFRFTVTNTGNVTLTNVQVTDNVYGLIGTLPSLAPGASFQWIITRPWVEGQHVDTATATGTTPTGQTVTDTDQAHYVGVIVKTNFKQLSIDETVRIPSQKPDAEDILNVLVDVEIIGKRVIKTTKGTSQEGQILTGYKLIVEGMLHQKIEYIANEPTQSVHAAEFSVPFSSFIILPENFNEDAIVNVVAYVEDVYYKQISRRCIFKNVTLRLEAEIIC